MNRLSLISAAAAAALLATACGGGGEDNVLDDRASREGRAVMIVSQGLNPIAVWGDIAFKTTGNAVSYDLVTTHLAMYDAVIAIAGTHEPYAVRPTTSAAGLGTTAMNAAAVEAAYRVLKALFPAGGANYEERYATDTAALPNGDEKTRGQAIGAEVAAGLLALRANDGRATVLPPYAPGTLPGQFRGVNPVNRIAPYVKPFATLSHAQFRAPGPPALTSDTYAADFNEVKAIAFAASPLRTPEQTEIARFHTEPPNFFWNRNLRQFATASSDLAENARLAAMLWTAFSDAGGGCFESKYHYLFWRPTSAIQLADTDDNPNTTADPAWTPHVSTPNHPEYPAAHGCAIGATMEIVRDHYETKKVSFDITSTVSGTVPHHYDSTDDLRKEMSNARVWGGMHFRSSTEDGAELGKNVAKWIVKHHFQPIRRDPGRND